MQQLIVNLEDAEFELLTTKAGSHDLSEIVKIALDEYFATHRFVEENTVPLDLSGRAKKIAELQAARPDPRKPVAPNRGELGVDGRCIFQEDADYEKAMAAYRWNLDRYNAEKSAFEAKKRNGTINAFGGVSCVL